MRFFDNGFFDKNEVVGFFTPLHFVILGLFIAFAVLFIYLAVKHLKGKEILIIRILAIIFLILEVFKTLWFADFDFSKLPRTLPLWYCGAYTPALILAGFTKGRAKKIGEAFLLTAYGAGFLAMAYLPSFEHFPLFHFSSIYGTLYHLTMVVISLMVTITGYIKFDKNSLLNFSILMVFYMIISLIFNYNLPGANYMFLAAPSSPDNPLTIIANAVSPIAFTVFVFSAMIFVPHFGGKYVYMYIWRPALKIDKSPQIT